jgi:hypothetical protein
VPFIAGRLLWRSALHSGPILPVVATVAVTVALHLPGQRSHTRTLY